MENNFGQIQLVDEKQAAKMLGLEVRTLQQRRYERKPPRYFKVGGRAVRYCLQDIMAFIQAGIIEPRLVQ